MQRKPYLLVAMLLLVAIVACDITQLPTLPPIVDTLISGDTTSGDALSTQVAATLTALATEPAVTEPPATEPPCETAAVLTVAYINNGDVWLVEGSSSPVQLTNTGNASDVAISDDGQKVAFTTWDDSTQFSELRALNSDGTGQAILMDQTDLDALPPALGGALHHTVHRMQFKPCSQNLLFSTRSFYEGPGLETQNNLLEIDTNSGILTTVLAPGSSGAGVFISPDGSRLALSFPERLDFANIDGSGLVSSAHTFTPVITYSEFMWNPPVQWAADSSSVGLAMPSSDPFLPGAYGEIWLIQADGSGATLSATITAKFYWIQSTEITISPDLTKLAYTRESGTPNVWNLYFSNFNGTSETLYDTADLRAFGWSPDSVNYAYVVSTGGGAQLRVGRLGYAPLTLVSGSGTYRDIQWVDSTRMLHFSGANPNWSLQLTQLGSGTTTLATISGGFLPSYDFAPKP